MRSITVLILLLVASVAHAQTATTRPVVDEKSPTIAVAVSIGVPVAGAITMAVGPNAGIKTLGFVGLYFGPSMGQWYAGKVGGLGLGLRALSLVTAVGALALVVDEECDIDSPCPTTPNDVIAGSLAIGAAGLWIGSSVYDVVLAKRATDRWNHDRALTLTPGFVGTGGQRAPGLFVGGRF